MDRVGTRLAHYRVPFNTDFRITTRQDYTIQGRGLATVVPEA